MIQLENIDIELLKKFLGNSIKLNFTKKGNIFYCNSDKQCKITSKENQIDIKFENENYIISTKNGNYSVLDYKSDGNIHRYVFNLNGEKGLFIFKTKLSDKEILHFLLSIFFIEKLV